MASWAWIKQLRVLQVLTRRPLLAAGGRHFVEHRDDAECSGRGAADVSDGNEQPLIAVTRTNNQGKAQGDEDDHDEGLARFSLLARVPLDRHQTPASRSWARQCARAALAPLLQLLAENRRRPAGGRI